MSDARQRALDALERANAVCERIDRDKAERLARDPFGIDRIYEQRERSPDLGTANRQPKERAMDAETQRQWDAWFDRRFNQRIENVITATGEALGKIRIDAVDRATKASQDQIDRLRARIDELEAQVDGRNTEGVARTLRPAVTRSNGGRHADRSSR